MTLKKEPYGKLSDGRAIEKFILTNSEGTAAELIN
jgi:hypothetical protein